MATPDFPGPEPISGGRWVKLGECDVDSATMAVMDPVVPNHRAEFMSGFGDGTYEVWARQVEIDPGDWRNVEVRVTLITDEDVTEWDEM